jgi:hypothetical protein
MKKLLITTLLLVPQLHAMQMGDRVTSKKIHNKTQSCSDTCCSTAAKALCLSALLVSGHPMGPQPGQVAAGHADDYPHIAAHHCIATGSQVSVVGLAAGTAIISTIANPRYMASCLAQAHIEHQRHTSCETGKLVQGFDWDVEKEKEKKD